MAQGPELGGTIIPLFGGVITGVVIKPGLMPGKVVVVIKGIVIVTTGIKGLVFALYH